MLRLATRGSPLALHQTTEVAEELHRIHGRLTLETVVVTTRGDRMAKEPLDRIGGQGVFVKEIQQAVLEGRADGAVHSAKDLPPVTPEGLVLACVPRRSDPRDVLVGRGLDDLSVGAIVATGSARRRAQLANLRPELSFVEIRGNVGTRLQRASEGEVDAVVTAVAALERLGLVDRAAEILSPLVMLPQVGQGALAVECREDDMATRQTLQQLEDPASRRCLLAERALLGALGASCAAPVAALARVTSDGGLTLEAMLASGDGRIAVRARAKGMDPDEIGKRLAEDLFVAHGAAVIEGVVMPIPPAPR